MNLKSSQSLTNHARCVVSNELKPSGAEIERIRAPLRICVLEPCYSGTFLPLIVRNQDIGVSSCSADEPSLAAPSLLTDEFTGLFFSNLATMSFSDAFDATRRQLSTPQTPQILDVSGLGAHLRF